MKPKTLALMVGLIGSIVSSVAAPAKYTLQVALVGTTVRNRWDFWVYPTRADEPPLGGIHRTAVTAAVAIP